ncbi:MAG: hypothetical protein GFH27_549297n318 [Chloroflexi bacterium AL-W]|nr:hypothetical protein [Chloroflexi bacterium AL-N1]NOK68829.1 hypothetical protein [Chloroflexi bacterium AL-N10]NOK76813.1 hypothetical protein [Chloroflexi bacterium AL-N5]NOK82800.1 hypothetical protein [Chloroflexi bacterium AL-W]NOK90670.1 hypothetical protein [Chloroflexi bacterium AL-N15]
MPFVAHDTARIWYDDEGDGTPVLLVHGGLFEPMNGECFWETPGIAEDLRTKGYRVLVPDRRFGTGRTTSTFTAHSWDIEAADLVKVITNAGVDKVHLIAGSNGCSAAIRLALNAPQHVRSLGLCWPATPDHQALQSAFEHSAKLIEQHGTVAYLDLLQAQGVPRPESGQAGFPWGFALLHDPMLTQSFRSLSRTVAANIIRKTAEQLLSGTVLRGVDDSDMQVLSNSAIPLAIMPAEPETPAHQHQTVHTLTGFLAKAQVLTGFPESPRPEFANIRSAFSGVLSMFVGDVEALSQ